MKSLSMYGWVLSTAKETTSCFLLQGLLGGGEGGKGPMRASPADKPMKWTGQGFCALLSSFVDNIPSRRHCLPPRGLWGSFPPPCSELDVPSGFGGSGGRLGADITLVAKVISTVVAW